MSPENITAAIKEAERFIARAKEAVKALKEANGWSSPKETGAARRASMDLTRALAEMRKPG